MKYWDLKVSACITIRIKGIYYVKQFEFYSFILFLVFWIFPYFNEGHILKCSGSKLAMSDFHVEYRNHAKYNGSGKLYFNF